MANKKKANILPPSDPRSFKRGGRGSLQKGGSDSKKTLNNRLVKSTIYNVLRIGISNCFDLSSFSGNLHSEKRYAFFIIISNPSTLFILIPVFLFFSPFSRVQDRGKEKCDIVILILCPSPPPTFHTAFRREKKSMSGKNEMLG